MSATYEPREPLGTGPSATVFRGQHCDLHYPVAIKQLRPELFNNVKHRERFFREAQRWAAIAHDHLVPIMDLDTEHGWIVMELMPQSLAVPIRQGSTSAAEVGRALEDCLVGLDHVHTQGYLHGNITPTNVFQDARQRFRLADGRGVSFKSLGELPAPAANKYSAPEMFEDSFGALGPATDLYCLGIVALELLVGPRFEDLFRGLSGSIADRNLAWIQWHGSHTEKAPSPRDVVSDVPTQLAITIERLLKKDVASRYASAREALEDLRREGGFTTPPSRAGRSGGGPSGSGAATRSGSGVGGAASGLKQPAKVSPTDAAARGQKKAGETPDAPHSLTILSGPRTGEIFGFDSDELLVGGDESCQLRLSEQDYPNAAGRRLLLRREATGWMVHRHGAAGLLVNQQLVSDAVAVRSGDILRLSPRGPDVQFVIQTAGKLSLSDLEARYAAKGDASQPQGHHAAASRATAPKPPSAAAPVPGTGAAPSPRATAPKPPAAPTAPPVVAAAPLPPQRPAPPPAAPSRPPSADDRRPLPPAPRAPTAPSAPPQFDESEDDAVGGKQPPLWSRLPDYSNWTNYKSWTKRTQNIVVFVVCSIIALVVLILVPSGSSKPTPAGGSPQNQAPVEPVPAVPAPAAAPRGKRLRLSDR